jgi:hypothetical protein
MFPSASPIRHLLNPRANPSLAYGPKQARILNRRVHQAAFKEIFSWDGYAATPLLNLEGMAGRLGAEAGSPRSSPTSPSPVRRPGITALAEPLSLGKDSRVLIIGSEGPA